MNIFKERYKEMGGDVEFFKLKRCIRVNTNKVSMRELKSRLEAKGVEVEKVSYLKNGFYVKSTKFNLVSSPEYLLGLFYIQDAAAQVPVEVLNPVGVALDAFAAPGGKTTQMVKYCNVVAIENNAERFKALENNIERLGVDNCIAYLKDFRTVEKKFDYILLDAPCSGNYMLEDHWLRKYKLDRVKKNAEKQKEFISHAIGLLNKGGILVYSTCSLEPEEDEEVIQYAIDNFDVKLEKIDLRVGDPGLTNIFGNSYDKTMVYCKRFWPSKTETIGFFVARLRKC
ncbi:MAG: RsmB/NOP family class I SAM-dependent RNA methyltransferase [Nanoarchaeota archaeon]|nr:RsmB/NOP family class I SAM-dependent RNA methyltransferase [Nanoarchaeota archaeon]